MSATGKNQTEQIADEALESLLRGEPAESILARYPRHAGELQSILSAAQRLARAPQPQIPPAFLAALVVQAQARAASQADSAFLIVPPVPAITGDRSGAVETDSAARGRQPVLTGARRLPLAERMAAWFRISNPLVGVPATLILLSCAVAAIMAMSQLTRKPGPIYPPVPVVSTQFVSDGNIEQMAGDHWLVGGQTIYLDAQTVISGTPSVGKRAHIEGNLIDGNRRVARNIMVNPGAPFSVSASALPRKIATVPAQPTLRSIIGGATSTTEAVHAASRSANTGALPSSTRVAALSATARPTRAVTRTPLSPTKQSAPTLIATSTAVISRAGTPTSIIQSPRANTAIPTKAAAIEPSSTATELPLTEATSTPALPTAPPPSPTTEQSPTERPTTEPVNTSVPEFTPRPHPTSTPGPKDTATPRPVTALPSTPTSQPTSQPTLTTPAVSTATQSREPHETETPEPTHGPGNTPTPESTSTRQPEETHPPEPTEHPHGTETAEPTHDAAPLPRP